MREHLAGRGFARVLTSPLSRAVETCELAGLAEGAEKLDDLQEWDYGAFDGQTSDQIRAHRPQWSLWDDGVPEGETLAEVAARADRVVATLRDTSPAPAGDVAVFAHGHLLRVLAATEDEAVARLMRSDSQRVMLVANKVDSETREPDAWAFARLGLGDPWMVSALHGRGRGTSWMR